MGQSGKQHCQCFVEDGARVRRIDTVIAQLVGGYAPPDTEFQPAAGYLIQHAHLSDEPQRIIEGQQVDQRSEADPSRALSRRGEEQRWRGRHTERCRMMLREMITVESGRIRRFQELQPILVQLVQRHGVALYPIEHPKGHLCHFDNLLPVTPTPAPHLAAPSRPHAPRRRTMHRVAAPRPPSVRDASRDRCRAAVRPSPAPAPRASAAAAP